MRRCGLDGHRVLMGMGEKDARGCIARSERKPTFFVGSVSGAANQNSCLFWPRGFHGPDEVPPSLSPRVLRHGRGMGSGDAGSQLLDGRLKGQRGLPWRTILAGQQARGESVRSKYFLSVGSGVPPVSSLACKGKSQPALRKHSWKANNATPLGPNRLGVQHPTDSLSTVRSTAYSNSTLLLRGPSENKCKP